MIAIVLDHMQRYKIMYNSNIVGLSQLFVDSTVTVQIRPKEKERKQKQLKDIGRLGFSIRLKLAFGTKLHS